MSRKLDSPVQTQRAVALFDSPCNCNYHGNTGMAGKSIERRHVFVPTETGCVSSPDLDLGNAQRVKRNLQLALNVPSEESILALGDLTLEGDVSAIQKESFHHLARNLKLRSSVTPCVLPTNTVKNLQKNVQTCPIKLFRHAVCSTQIKELLNEIMNAIKNGIDPLPVHGGLGGAYYFKNSRGDSVAIVKPTDEEPFAPNNPKGFVGRALGQPGLKRSVRIGESGFREVAAFLLDYGNFANVPPTILVKITHPIFNVNDAVNGTKLQDRTKISKIASLQQYINHDCDANDYGTSGFPVASVHRIGILDIRIFNTDRHAGNLLVRKLRGHGKLGQVELVPIDHGLCLPESLEDPYFEWIHWPQASVPFSNDELEYINNLDPARDCDMLRTELPMIRDACLRVLVLCTIFLKEAAAFGLCLAEIGEMMSREYKGQDEEPSELEVVCIEARRFVFEDFQFSETEAGDNEIQFDLDCDNAESDLIPEMAKEFSCTGSLSFSSRGVHSQNSLLKLAKSTEEDEIQVVEEPAHAYDIGSGHSCSWFPTVSKTSSLLKKINSNDKNQRHQGGKPEHMYTVDSFSTNRRSANEQLPTATNFVKLADMTEGEWNFFLENFMELLYLAFAKRRSTTIWQRQRLGTSCQF